jgi:uncharacterized membrane protein
MPGSGKACMWKRNDLINSSKGAILNQRRLTSLIVWYVFLSVAFSGCIYVGSDSSRVNLNKETASKIIPGKTTREEVLTMLGPPDELLGDGKQVTYVRKYEVALISPGGPGSGKQLSPANRYLLKVDFDEQGIVSRRDFIAPYEFHDKTIHGVPPFSPPPSWR